MAEQTAETVSGYLAVPASGTGKAVLVLHAWWGLNAFFTGLCDRLASEGFVAFAPDLYEGQVAATPAEAERMRDAPRSEPAQDTLLRAVAQLRAHPTARGEMIGVIGFSMGGYWGLWLAQRGDLPIGAVAFYYATGPEDYTQSRAAFQGHFAASDEWEPEAEVNRLKRNLATAGRPAAFFVYPGTGHWFFESDRPDAYDAGAAELAWNRTIQFLKAHLG